MLKTLLAAALLAAPLLASPLSGLLGDEDPERKPPPTAEEIEKAVGDLERAFKGKDPQKKLEAIERGREVLDKEVVHVLARGIREREKEVQVAVLEALRLSEHPAALDELHSIYKREKKLRDDEDLYAGIVRGIAQHRSEDSIPLLAEYNLADMTYKVGKARVWGLGMIRSPKSVEALFDLMKRIGRHKLQGFMDEFRVSLIVLTGADNGKSQDAWQKWWNENKRDLTVRPKPPELPRDVERRWSAYWGLEPPRKRQKRRGERGGDDPDGGEKKRPDGDS